MLQACSGGNSGAGGKNNGGSTNTNTNCTLGNVANVTVSGMVTFDRVALLSSGSLDFNNISQQPLKGAVVEAICNGILVSTGTDANGNYSLSIPGNTSGVFIRVKAQLLRTGTPSWDVAVSDETQAVKLIFSMDGSQFNSGTSNSSRNLNAASGWGGSSYTSTRVAAPFAILDTIYDAMQLVLAANSSAQFPPLDVKWSASSITGTYYTNNIISLVGRVATDTDEFDEHVIAHEWAHYFTDTFSRDDSIGGSHTLQDILDIRVAFSEGFGNAFSAMVTGEPVYKDSQGLSAGFNFDIESNNCGANRGWFSECSVQSVLYDFYDVANDDALNLGFAPIYTVLTTNIPATTAVTSLFSFITPFKALNAGSAANIDSLLLTDHSIATITDDAGTTRTLNPGTTDQLPVYATSFPASLCVTGENGGYNGLGVHRFVQFTAPASANFTFTATRTSGLASSDPDMSIYSSGVLTGFGESTVNNTESFSVNLVAGTVYVLDLNEYANYSDEAYDPSGSLANETCFSVTRTQN